LNTKLTEAACAAPAPQLQHPVTMPNQPQDRQNSHQNARRGPNISPAQRLQIITKRECGATLNELVAEFGRSMSAIRYTLRTYANTTNPIDKPRSGRPPVLSRHQKKILYRAVRATPKIEYSELVKAVQLMNPDGTLSKPPSHDTLYRELKRQCLTNLRAKKRPKLTRGHALARLRFCRAWRHFPWSRRTVKFSDECTIEKGTGQNQEWVFRFLWETWNLNMIQTYGTGKRPSQMVWACIWLDKRGHPRRSPLVIMERDPDAPRYGYTSKSYIQALTEGLLPRWRRSQQFMQDNARVHTSQRTRAFLAEHHITPITWPAYSPDLNPIEHLWWQLKKLMARFYPQYSSYSRSQEEWDGFCRALKDCWRRIPNLMIRSLILSMPRRTEACRRARGWQTKY
jgi:transposase